VLCDAAEERCHVDRIAEIVPIVAYHRAVMEPDVQSKRMFPVGRLRGGRVNLAGGEQRLVGRAEGAHRLVTDGLYELTLEAGHEIADVREPCLFELGGRQVAQLEEQARAVRDIRENYGERCVDLLHTQ
jgi:hypothetical protein